MPVAVAAAEVMEARTALRDAARLENSERIDEATELGTEFVPVRVV